MKFSKGPSMKVKYFYLAENSKVNTDLYNV